MSCCSSSFDSMIPLQVSALFASENGFLWWRRWKDEGVSECSLLYFWYLYLCKMIYVYGSFWVIFLLFCARLKEQLGLFVPYVILWVIWWETLLFWSAWHVDGWILTLGPRPMCKIIPTILQLLADFPQTSGYSSLITPGDFSIFSENSFLSENHSLSRM